MKRNWITYCLTFVLLISLKVYPQGEATFWYFGVYTGLKFEQNGPVLLSNSAMYNLTGSATISDKYGNLLFYTNGRTIWNQEHDTMENGYGLFSGGESVQGAMIIPLPGNPYLYYLFTVAVADGWNSHPGFWYHIVDIRLDGGKGAIIEKNKYICGNVTAKLAATYHSDRKSVWVMVHEWNSNRYKAYRLQNTGLDTVPVISVIGTEHNGVIDNVQGQLKISASGSKLACAIYYMGKVDLCDFNNSTGRVSNSMTFDFRSTNNYKTWGVEFSPSEKLLYVSYQGAQTGVYQADISSGIDSVIRKSFLSLYSNHILVSRYFSIQIGPDKKLYVNNRERWISCIEKPDIKGPGCNFIPNYLITPRSPGSGLPTFLQSYFYLPDIEVNHSCLGDTTSIRLRDTANIDSVRWNLGDGTVTKDFYPMHIYQDTGYYTIMAKVYYDNTYDSFDRRIRIGNYPQASFSLSQSSQCLKGNLFNFTNTSSAVDGTPSWYWSFGDSTFSGLQQPQKTYLQPGTYPVKLLVNSIYGCSDSMVKIVRVHPEPQAGFSINDTAQCFNENKFTFHDTTSISEGIFTSLWDFGDGNTLPAAPPAVDHHYTRPGILQFPVTLVATSDSGCTDSSTQIVTIHPSPVAAFDINDTGQCFREQAFILSDNSFVSNDSITHHEWIYDNLHITGQKSINLNGLKNGPNSIMLNVATVHGCTDTIIRKVTVFPSPSTSFVPNETAACFNSQGFKMINTSSVSNGSMICKWILDADTLPSINLITESLPPGTHPLKLICLTDKNCSDTARAQLTVFPSPTARFAINDSAQCLKGNRVELTNKSYIASGSLNFHWTLDTVSMYVYQPTPFSFDSDGARMLRLIAISDKGCTDTAYSNIIIYPGVTASYSWSNNCLNDSLRFYDRSSANAYKWLWNFGDGFYSSQRNPVHTYTIVGDYLVSLTVNSNYGCSDDTATSLHIKTPVSTPLMNRATVTEDNYIMVEWEKPSDGNVVKYTLQRSTDSIIWKTLNESRPFVFNYVDADVEPGKQLYYYRLTASDSCDYTAPWSDIARNILLRLDDTEGFPVLSWNPYIYWPGGVSHYLLELSAYNTDDDPDNKVFLPFNTYIFPAIVSDSSSNFHKDYYAYRVTAFSNDGRFVSLSNEVSFAVASSLFIPDAFSPNGDGFNDVFSPAGIYLVKYDLQVYSKWGELLFNTTDINKGWDGSYRGASCPVGTYYYQITANGLRGKKINRSGSLLLVR